MKTYRVWFIQHTMTARERQKWETYRANPEKTPAPVIRYRKKRMVKDVEAEDMLEAVKSIGSVPMKEGDPYNKIWGACPTSATAELARFEAEFHSEEQPLFSEEELKKCAR